MRRPVSSLLTLALGLTLGTAALTASGPLGTTAAAAAAGKAAVSARKISATKVSATKISARKISATKKSPTRPQRSAKASGRRPAKHARKQTAKRTGRHTVKRPARRVFLEAQVPSMKGKLPNVQARGALVVDLDTGQELFNRAGDTPRPIASVSKLAATLVAMDHGLELEGLTTITKTDLQVARGGATSRLHEGMTLTNRDLLHAALLGSDNRAVSALGRAVGLGSSQFAAAMTKRARALGLKQTRFVEPTGLSPENQASPRELIAMLNEVMKHPVLGPITRKMEYDAHPVARPPIHYVSTHRPASRAHIGVLGGKTGYNDAARYCLVIATRVDGRSLGMVFLGTEGKLTRFGDVARVADYVLLHKPKGPGGSTAIATSTPTGTSTSTGTSIGTSTTTPGAAAEILGASATVPGLRSGSGNGMGVPPAAAQGSLSGTASALPSGGTAAHTSPVPAILSAPSASPAPL